MKIGVSTDPCGKTKCPQRADVDGSVARMVNDTENVEKLVNAAFLAKPNQAPKII